MKFLDYIRLAFKNIGRQKLRTGLTIFAVIIGATSVTIMLALAPSAKDFFLNQFEATGQLEQVTVQRSTDLHYYGNQFTNGGPTDSNSTTPRLDDAMVAKIKSLPHVVNLTAVTQADVFDSLSFHATQLALGPQGGQTEAYDPNGTIKELMVAGRDLRESDGTGTVVISTAYADALGFKQNYGALVGQTITLHTQYGYSGEGSPVPPQPPRCPGNGGCGQQQPIPCKGGQPLPPGPGGPACNPSTNLSANVVGVASYGGKQAIVTLPLKWAVGLLETRQWVTDDVAFQKAQQAYQQARQACFNLPPSQQFQCNQQQPPQPTYTLATTSQLGSDGYGEIIVQADSAIDAEPVAASIRAFGVGAVSAQAYVNQQLGVFNVLALILGAIGAIALAVAAIGVINTMVMAILERTREIGVLRACGATRSTIRRLYTFEAAMLGFWGGVLGVLLGFLLTLIANPIVNRQLQLNSVTQTNIIAIPPWLIVVVVVATTLIGMLAGLYPANRAARLNPVDALRYE